MAYMNQQDEGATVNVSNRSNMYQTVNISNIEERPKELVSPTEPYSRHNLVRDWILLCFSNHFNVRDARVIETNPTDSYAIIMSLGW